TFLTPNPLKEVTYPLTYLLHSGTAFALISEYRSPNFHSLGSLPLALAILKLAGHGLFRRHHDLFLPLLGLGSIFLVLQASRNQPLFAIAFVVVAAALVANRHQP